MVGTVEVLKLVPEPEREFLLQIRLLLAELFGNSFLLIGRKLGLWEHCRGSVTFHVSLSQLLEANETIQ